MDRERYLLPVTTFLLPLCLLEVDGWRRRARGSTTRLACIALMGLNLPLFAARALAADFAIQQRTRPGERFYAADNPAWSNPDLEQLATWIRANVREDEVVCAESPFLINFFTGSLAVVQPGQIRASEFSAFLRACKVSFWIINPVYTKQPGSALKELREAVRTAGGKAAARCGTYEIWRLPE
jgi:hypothetical protein